MENLFFTYNFCLEIDITLRSLFCSAQGEESDDNNCKQGHKFNIAAVAKFAGFLLLLVLVLALLALCKICERETVERKRLRARISRLDSTLESLNSAELGTLTEDQQPVGL